MESRDQVRENPRPLKCEMRDAGRGGVVSISL